MVRKSQKYLVDTSAVLVALGESTPAHCEHFCASTADGELWTSIYIRMEFSRRWIKYYLRFASTLDHFGSLTDALRHENQAFSDREVKALSHLISLLVGPGGSATNQTCAEEVARIAIWELRKFDRRFRNRTSNSCGCKIGGKELKIDFNHLWDDLRGFFHSTAVQQDCPINGFLGSGPTGRAATLLADPTVATKTKSGNALADLREKNTWVTCRECQRIGDAVIALEQPRHCCLVHIDLDFEILCGALQKQHKQVRSERAVEKDVPKPAQ